MSTGEVVSHANKMPSEELPGSRVETKNARRCLFGPVNHDENRRILETELQIVQEMDREKWNFDFQLEKPVDNEGKRYDWTRVVQTTNDEHSIKQTRITDFMRPQKNHRVAKSNPQSYDDVTT